MSDQTLRVFALALVFQLIVLCVLDNLGVLAWVESR